MSENHPSVIRVTKVLSELGVSGQVRHLSESARSAKEAADALGIEVGQVASSIVFKLPDERALLVITSGRHRVDTDLVAKEIGVEKLGRADADFVKEKSGFAIGGVAPIGWVSPPGKILIDLALDEHQVAWAAAGHPHTVFPTSFNELLEITGGTPMKVGD